MSEPMLFMGEFRSGRTQREWRGNPQCSSGGELWGDVRNEIK